MKNAMQFKAIIKAIVKEKSISAQLVMQNYMLETIIPRGDQNTRSRNSYHQVSNFDEILNVVKQSTTMN